MANFCSCNPQREIAFRIHANLPRPFEGEPNEIWIGSGRDYKVIFELALIAVVEVIRSSKKVVAAFHPSFS